MQTQIALVQEPEVLIKGEKSPYFKALACINVRYCIIVHTNPNAVLFIFTRSCSFKKLEGQ